MIQVPAYEDPHEASELALSALVFAKREIGHGEEGGNNRGRDVKRYRFGIDNHEPWCAAFVSYCYIRGASRISADLPFEPTHGAKRLYKRIGKAGMFSSVPIIGDVACWDRGAKGSWQGHVGIVCHVAGSFFQTIEGNRGAFPSRVRVYGHEVGEGRLIGFARV